jgi:hypothetical protein
MQRFKNFNATGIAPDGRLYAGDLNLLEDLAAAASDFTQTVDAGTFRVGDSSLSLTKYGAGELSLSSMLRISGIVRMLGGFIGPVMTTAQRDALGAGLAPTGLGIFNSTTNRYEFNSGTDGARAWLPLGARIYDPTIFLGAVAIWPSLSGGASPSAQVTVNAADVFVMDFADAVTQSAQGNFPLPWDFQVGGVLQARFVWTTASASAGAIRWGCIRFDHGR